MVIRLNINIFQRDLLYILVRFLIEKWDKVVEDRGVFGALLTDLSKSSMREKLPNMEFFLGPHLPVFRPEETLYLDTFHTVFANPKKDETKLVRHYILVCIKLLGRGNQDGTGC